MEDCVMHFMIRYFHTLRAKCIVIVKVQALLKKKFDHITNSIFSQPNTLLFLYYFISILTLSTTKRRRYRL